MKKPTARQLELLREMVAAGEPIVHERYWACGRQTDRLAWGSRRASWTQLGGLIARGLAARGTPVTGFAGYRMDTYIPTDAGRQLITQEAQA